MIEVGLARERIANWFGLVSPPACPTPWSDDFDAELRQGRARQGRSSRRMTNNGTLIAATSPQEIAAHDARRGQDVAELVKALGLQVK